MKTTILSDPIRSVSYCLHLGKLAPWRTTPDRTAPPYAPSHRRRAGYSLVELVVGLGAASLLMTGMASAMFLAGRTLDHGGATAVRTKQTRDALDHVATDVGHATGFTERTPNAIAFQVPARDADGTPETIRYSWSGTAGDPLLVAHNGGTPAVLAPGVDAFNLNYRTRAVTGTGFAKGQLGVQFEEFTEFKNTGYTYYGYTGVILPRPPGTTPGDLLIAAVAAGGNGYSRTFYSPAGWTKIAQADRYRTIFLVVWAKYADGTEPDDYTFYWTGSEHTYGWLMRFTGHRQPGAIPTLNTNSGYSSTPTAPAVNVTVPNTLVLRLGAFQNRSITVGSPGLSGHTSINMDRTSASSTSAVSGGSGWLLQGTTGSSGTSNFALRADQRFATATIAIVPPD